MISHQQSRYGDIFSTLLPNKMAFFWFIIDWFFVDEIDKSEERGTKRRWQEIWREKSRQKDVDIAWNDRNIVFLLIWFFFSSFCSILNWNLFYFYLFCVRIAKKTNYHKWTFASKAIGEIIVCEAIFFYFRSLRFENESLQTVLSIYVSFSSF